MLSDKEINKKLDKATLRKDDKKLYSDIFDEKAPTSSDTWGKFPVDTILEAIDKKKPIEKKQSYEKAQIVLWAKIRPCY